LRIAAKPLPLAAWLLEYLECSQHYSHLGEWRFVGNPNWCRNPRVAVGQICLLQLDSFW